MKCQLRLVTESTSGPLTTVDAAAAACNPWWRNKDTTGFTPGEIDRENRYADRYEGYAVDVVRSLVPDLPGLPEHVRQECQAVDSWADAVSAAKAAYQYSGGRMFVRDVFRAILDANIGEAVNYCVLANDAAHGEFGRHDTLAMACRIWSRHETR